MQIFLALFTHHSLCQMHPDLQQNGEALFGVDGLTKASHSVPERLQLSLDLNAQRCPIHDLTRFL